MVAKKTPEHDLKDFVRDCAIKDMVYVPSKVRKDAKRDFYLKNQSEILAFIDAGGLDNATHQNTSTIDKWPQLDIGEIFDAYEFKIGTKHGYIAFYKNPRKTQWIIKSLHKQTFGEHSEKMMHNPFAMIGDNLK